MLVFQNLVYQYLPPERIAIVRYAALLAFKVGLLGGAQTPTLLDAIAHAPPAALRGATHQPTPRHTGITTAIRQA